MKFQPGQDVMVDVFGMEHHGEVLWQSRGWTMCVIATDPLAEYPAVLDPRTTVCVPDARVRSLS
jgi:hypothetical protein